MSDDLDIYADDLKPEVSYRSTIHHVVIPGHQRTHWADVRVWNSDGLAELADWGWNGERDIRGPIRSTDPAYETQHGCEQEIWEWLSEWELVESRRIGPEDSEWFATRALDPEHGLVAS